ncbi:lysozyme inhibitor LprI family protein [Trinickia dabaoshanensis]|nr:lysozyme inhibitor LprI family protein [Trinickia dabaoshanensis]
MRFLKVMISLSVMSFSTAVLAVDCDSPPGGVGLDSAQANLQCVERVQKENDKKLNASYKKLLGILRDNSDEENFSHSQLVSTERAWIAFRDAECELKASLAGGAHQWRVVNQAQCISDMTAERTSQLNKYYEDASDN